MKLNVFAFLPVVFYKNVFLGIVILKKNVFLYFMKAYVSISTPKYASINTSKYVFCMLSSYLCENTIRHRIRTYEYV